jgi:alkylated DNA repair protein (DNA oxidative demethylase)
MKKLRDAATGNLLSSIRHSSTSTEALAQGATLLRGFASSDTAALMEALKQVIVAAPFRHMVTPGGFRMSVAMSNCGRVGWVTDRIGYRYAPVDPTTRRPWPPIPATFMRLATRAAAAGGFAGFAPDVCLINRYEPGAQLSLHQDKDERDFGAPIVSVSLGVSATFLFGSAHRRDRPRRVRLENGDVVVWGGPARMAFHGIAPLAESDHPLTGRCRVNLTFRKAL